jgi:hypothetical protein
MRARQNRSAFLNPRESIMPRRLVDSRYSENLEITSPPSCREDDCGRPQLVRIARNYIHDNARDASGYGVRVGAGAYPLIEGNTFNMNRHAISGRSEVASWRAVSNLVGEDAPGWLHQSHDFDIHGSIKEPDALAP